MVFIGIDKNVTVSLLLAATLLLTTLQYANAQSMFPQQQPGSQTPQLEQTGEATLGSPLYSYFTYTDPSSGKSIQYPPAWTARGPENCSDCIGPSRVLFLDSDGVDVAEFGVTNATSPDPKTSVLDQLNRISAHVNQSNENASDITLLGKTAAHFDYFTTAAYLFNGQAPHIEGVAMVRNGMLLWVTWFPDNVHDPNYQGEIMNMVNSLIGSYSNNGMNQSGMNSNNGMNQGGMNSNNGMNQGGMNSNNGMNQGGMNSNNGMNHSPITCDPIFGCF
jgi:hypothetical protein